MDVPKSSAFLLCLLLVLAVGPSTAAPQTSSKSLLVSDSDSDAIVFENDPRRRKQDAGEIITPPVLPVIEHLEHDPTTLTREEKRLLHEKHDSSSNKLTPKTRFGLNGGFDVSPSADGGFTASFSHGFSGLGHSQTGSHSFSLGAGAQGNGFQVSQSSSQASSFNGGPSSALLGNSLSGSQSSSQSSSFGAGLNGLSSSSSGSSANSLSGNAFGQGFSSSAAQSQSAANSFGPHGASSAFGQGSGHAATLPNGQTLAGGQSASGAFGPGASAGASGGGFAAQTGGSGGGFGASAANAQSQASTGFGGSTGFGQATGFGGQSTGFGGSPGFNNDNLQFVKGGTTSGPAPIPIRFPGAQSNRYPKFNARPFPPAPWRQPYRQPVNRRKPSRYQIIRIEV